MADTEPTFFLHHYEASPYAEKIRAMFGLTGDHWGSVLSPPYPPRPNVDPLAGGYRRIPVAQIGADVFCDSTLIAAEVAAFTGRDELMPEIEDPLGKAIAERAEGDVFFAAITSIPPLKLLGTLILRSGPFATVKFVRDRSGMMKGASVRPPQGAAAASIFDGFLADLNKHLADREYVSGDEPSYADFCAYHPIWLGVSIGGAKRVRGYDKVQRWMGSLAKLGHGGRQEKSPEDAFHEATAFEPRELPADADAHDAMGKTVTITPGDYAKIGVTGTLVAVTTDRYVLARDTEAFGKLHVHFARQGYEVSSA